MIAGWTCARRPLENPIFTSMRSVKDAYVLAENANWLNTWAFLYGWFPDGWKEPANRRITYSSAAWTSSNRRSKVLCSRLIADSHLPHAAATAQPQAKPYSCGAASGRLRAPAARPGACTDAVGVGGLRVRRPAALPVFPDHQHRLAALHDGKRHIGGNRHHRQRGPGRHLLVHGRPKHAEPGGGPKRRRRLPAQGADPQERVRAGRSHAISCAALHAGADHA